MNFNKGAVYILRRVRHFNGNREQSTVSWFELQNFASSGGYHILEECSTQQTTYLLGVESRMNDEFLKNWFEELFR
jgi:hypothetical protein